MRGILSQVTVPPLLVALGAFIGWVGGYPLPGLGVGLLAGMLLALRVGIHARTRLQMLADLSRSDGGEASDGYSPGSIQDELDQAYIRVASRLRALERAYTDELGTLSRQSQLLDRMNDGIMRVDANGIVSYANVAAGALFRGRNPTGLSFIAVTHDHELSDLVQLNQRTGEDQQHTFEIPGEQSVYNAVITRLADSPAESLVVLRDISEVTRLQTLRRDFVGNVSHDLRTPLSAIKIMTETLLELREDDPESRYFLTKIDDEVNVMTALVNDLLDLASLEGREGRLTMRSVDVQRLIDEVQERMEPIANRQGVTLSVNVEPDLDPVQADERRVHQVLVNLVNNAIVYTPEGGHVEISAMADNRSVAFEVHDTGAGIHPDDLPRVWERFFRGERSRTGRGTGLGLAIVKHIVLAHGGTIDAKSEVGRGSVFRVTFPKVQPRNVLSRNE